jgi:hypothetical protein
MAPQENGYHICDFWLEFEQENGLQHINPSMPQEFTQVLLHGRWFLAILHRSSFSRIVAILKCLKEFVGLPGNSIWGFWLRTIKFDYGKVLLGTFPKSL